MTASLLRCAWCGRTAETVRRPWMHRYEVTKNSLVLVCELEQFELICGHVVPLGGQERVFGEPFTQHWCDECKGWRVRYVCLSLTNTKEQRSMLLQALWQQVKA